MIEMKMMRHRTNERKEKQTKGTKLILKILTQEYMNMKSLRKSQYHSGFKIRYFAVIFFRLFFLQLYNVHVSTVDTIFLFIKIFLRGHFKFKKKNP